MTPPGPTVVEGEVEKAVVVEVVEGKAAVAEVERSIELGNDEDTVLDKRC